MLLFACTFLEEIRPEGLTSEGEPFRLHPTLDAARVACAAPDGQTGRMLVLDPDRLALATTDPPTTHQIPREAALNLDADGGWRAPEVVAAAGGAVVRRRGGGVEVLLIFRRGAWDLPKGKLDRGETPEAGALREVSEEVGVPEAGLRLLKPLGATVHGYPLPDKAGRPPRYAVKTTHWFALTTDAERFRPQADEGIEAAAWVPLPEAGARLDYESLRTFVAALDPDGLGL